VREFNFGDFEPPLHIMNISYSCGIVYLELDMAVNGFFAK